MHKEKEEISQQSRIHQFPTFEEYVFRLKNHSKGCPCCIEPLELKSDNSPEFERSHQQVRF